MKGLCVETRVQNLSAADKANGIEWSGVVDVGCEVYRTARMDFDPQTNKAVRVAGKWGEWKKGDLASGIGQVPLFNGPLIVSPSHFPVTVRNGKWEWCVNSAQKPDGAVIP